jgi:hypothetical protein
MDVFRGKLSAVNWNGVLLRPASPAPSRWKHDTISGWTNVLTHLLTPVPPSRRQAIIVRLANEQHEAFTLAQRGEAAVFRTAIGASRLKLRPLLLELDRALSPGTATDPVLTLLASSSPSSISLRRVQPSGEKLVALRRTVGLAWFMIFPWDIALNPRWWPANAIWLVALMFPVTFMAMRSRRLRPPNRRARFEPWPIGLVLISLIVAPALMGLSFLGLGEWLGVVTGVAAGALAERAAPLPLSKETSGMDLPPTDS